MWNGHVHVTNTVTHSRRSFSYSSPHLWNRLPEEIKRAASQQAFCKVLKTDLFSLFLEFLIYFYVLYLRV